MRHPLLCIGLGLVLWNLGSPVPAATRLDGTVMGLEPRVVRCQNLTQRQTVQVRGTGNTWDCQKAGLAIFPGDRIKVTLRGLAAETRGTLLDVTDQCFVESQPVSCTNPGSQTVTTITPTFTFSFTEPMHRTSVEQNLDLIMDNLTDSVSVRDTLEGMVADQLVAIAWNSSSTQLTVTVLQVARQLENGKSYRVTASVVPGQCVETDDGDLICEGTLGPFLLQVRLP